MSHRTPRVPPGPSIPSIRPAVRVCLRVATVALLAASVAVPGIASAGEADVVDVSVTALGDGRFRIDASVAHADTGWDHYADRWDVYDEAGNLLGTRELAHPHENEQPFTRSTTVTIPDGVERIEVRAHDSVHGGGGEAFTADVPR